MIEASELSSKRKKELISEIKEQIDRGIILHYQIMNIGKTDEECDFLYSWLEENKIRIDGEEELISSESVDELYRVEAKDKKKKNSLPEVLDEKEQMELFRRLSEFKHKDRDEMNPEYIEIRNKLITHNMRLAKWVTSKGEIPKIKIAQKDKETWAYIGLMKAVEKFNPRYGFKFSTYAVKTIYRRIIREAYKEDNILKLNIELNEQLKSLQDAEEWIFKQIGSEATPDQLAEELNISLERLALLFRIRGMREKESLEQIEEDKLDIDNVAAKLYDGEKITESGEHYVMEGVYMDEQDILPMDYDKRDMNEVIALSNDGKRRIRNAVKKLPAEQRFVIIRRYGLGKREYTIEEIAKKMKVDKWTVYNYMHKGEIRLKSEQGDLRNILDDEILLFPNETEELKEEEEFVKTTKSIIDGYIEKCMRICKVLYGQGVDFSKIKITQNMIVAEVEQEGINIQKIIDESELDGEFKIGQAIEYLRIAYRGEKYYPLTELEKREVEELGLVSIKRENLTELVEQSKATQEKVAEAKKLESMYEQELEGKEQKESSDMGDDSK